MIVPTMQLALSAEVVSSYRHIKHQIGGSTTCFFEGYRLCLRRVIAPNAARSLNPTVWTSFLALPIAQFASNFQDAAKDRPFRHGLFLCGDRSP